jgi:hypothetical protein
VLVPRVSWEERIAYAAERAYPLRKEAVRRRRMAMYKPRLLKIVNAVLFVCIVNQIATGLLSDLANKDVFEILHPVGGILTALMAAAHVFLNWAWVKSNFLR